MSSEPWRRGQFEPEKYTGIGALDMVFRAIIFAVLIVAFLLMLGLAIAFRGAAKLFGAKGRRSWTA